MEVFIISPSQDTGGQAGRIVRAFKRHAPDWSVRSMRASTNFLNHPGDLEWDESKARELYSRADVVHHQNGLACYERFDGGQQKPTVLHHQGTRLRNHPLGASGEGRSAGAVQLVSTPDLLADCPGSTWLPQLVNIEEMEQYRVVKSRRRRRIRIGHAPTNQRAKNTPGILSVLNKLSKEYEIEVDLIEGVEWVACLSRKARCDIIIDQVTLGYGNNAVEAMAMGIPVVSGWDDPQDRELFIQVAGMTPQFVEASIETLADALKPLIMSEEIRDEWGRRGRDFVSILHDERHVVSQLKQVYSKAPASTGHVELFKPVKEKK